MEVTGSSSEWHQTACILCSINCGVEVQIDGGHITRVRGDRTHTGRKGQASAEPGMTLAPWYMQMPT